ncbi:MAG: response regulator transcription factor [Planctomycetota bacterium]
MFEISKGDVLVVDDAEPIRQFMQLTLERSGYEVRLCSDAIEACREIESRQPEYIVSDWQMPRMDGAALCQWVRAKQFDRYTYFILMTAHENEFGVVDGLDAGADAYLQKPIQLDELLAKLRCGERILELQKRLTAPAESVTGTDLGEF